MHDKPDQIDPLEEELVAYLDGELDEHATKEVEQKLTEDSSYRLRLKELQEAWDALDTLPRGEVSQSFTASTIELVLASEKKQLRDRRKSYEWVSRIAFTAVLLTVGIWLGYISTQFYQNRDNQSLIENLTLIENVDMYREVESIEFLEKLHHEGIFAPEVTNE